MNQEEKLLRFGISLAIVSLVLFLISKIIGYTERNPCEVKPIEKVNCQQDSADEQ